MNLDRAILGDDWKPVPPGTPYRHINKAIEPPDNPDSKVFRQGDLVRINTGPHKGCRGRVTVVYPRECTSSYGVQLLDGEYAGWSVDMYPAWLS